MRFDMGAGIRLQLSVQGCGSGRLIKGKSHARFVLETHRIPSGRLHRRPRGERRQCVGDRQRPHHNTGAQPSNHSTTQRRSCW
jgi:hypothetical protein